MKKRIMSMVLMVAFVVNLLPMVALPASAATTLGSIPCANVEYGYSADVSCGTIRYMRQVTDSDYIGANGLIKEFLMYMQAQGANVELVAYQWHCLT